MAEDDARIRTGADMTGHARLPDPSANAGRASHDD
jgi:hypothetical protein